MKALVDEVARRCANTLAERCRAVNLAVGTVYHIRNIVGGVTARRKRRRVVGGYQNAEILARRNKIFVYRFDYFFIYYLDRADFSRNVALMSALVGGFKVRVNKINAFFEPFYRRLRLTVKVGMEIARRAVNIDKGKARYLL